MTYEQHYSANTAPAPRRFKHHLWRPYTRYPRTGAAERRFTELVESDRIGDAMRLARLMMRLQTWN
jgi:hypothetical protein